MGGIDSPSYATIVAEVLTDVDALLNNYVVQGYPAIASYLRLPLGLITSIYIAIFGYGIAMGWVRLSIGNFVKACLKIGMIYLVITSWSWVSDNIINFFDDLVSGVGNALVQANPMPIPDVNGLDEAMQTVLTQFSTIGNTLFQTGGITNAGPWLDGLIIWAFGYLIVGLALFEIILAKVMLAVLWVFLPLVVLFCYFKPFQGIS